MDENLKELFTQKQRLWERYHNLGFTNVWGISIEERIKFDLVYEEARLAWSTAESAYGRAIAAAMGPDAAAPTPPDPFFSPLEKKG